MNLRTKITTTMFWATLIIFGCSADPVAVVKTANLDLDKSATIGNALDNYAFFSNTNWTAFEDSQKRKIVKFTGIIDADLYLKEVYPSASTITDPKKWLTRYSKEQNAKFEELAIIEILFLVHSDLKGCNVGAINAKFNNKDIVCANPILAIYSNKPMECISSSFQTAINKVKIEAAKAEAEVAERDLIFRDGLITDSHTGLMWVPAPNKDTTWHEADAYARNLDVGGYRDWRLPTRSELKNLYGRSNQYKVNPAFGVTDRWVWTSELQGLSPWYFGFDSGNEDAIYRGFSNGTRVLAVRQIDGATKQGDLTNKDRS